MCCTLKLGGLLKVMEPIDGAELLDVIFEHQDEPFSGTAFAGSQPRSTSPLQDHAYGCVPEKVGEGWLSNGEQGLNDSDTDDLLQLLIDPNEVCGSRSPATYPESDSGISEDPRADTPLQGMLGPTDLSPTVIYEVICDTGMRNGDTLPGHIFPNPVENWTTPPVMLPEACVMGEALSPLLENAGGFGTAEISGDQDRLQQMQLVGLYLTDEERRLLNQEGISLRCNLPLTKAEERILKKVRRKIRNKQSAQDSRRRKKEYINGLESRVAACSAQNHQLQKQVQQLEAQNVSLLSQLQKIQGLIKQTSTKAAQTSTCLVILVLSLGLIILPNYSSFIKRTEISQDGYKPSGVISRTILTEGDLSDREEPFGVHDPDFPPPRTDRFPEVLEVSDGEKRASESPPAVGEKVTNTSSSGPSNSQGEPKEDLVEEEITKTGKDLEKQKHADEM